MSHKMELAIDICYNLKNLKYAVKLNNKMGTCFIIQFMLNFRKFRVISNYKNRSVVA